MTIIFPTWWVAVNLFPVFWGGGFYQKLGRTRRWPFSKPTACMLILVQSASMKGCIISAAGVDSSRAAVTRSLRARAAIFKRCSMVRRNKRACVRTATPWPIRKVKVSVKIGVCKLSSHIVIGFRLTSVQHWSIQRQLSLLLSSIITLLKEDSIIPYRYKWSQCSGTSG